MTAKHTSYFRVGGTPIEVSDLYRSWDFKLVNYQDHDLGMYSEPSILTEFFVFDDSNLNEVFDPGEFRINYLENNLSLNPVLNNTYREYDGEETLFVPLLGTVIVGPQLTIGLSSSIIVDTYAGGFNPLSGSTLEADGRYAGFKANFGYRTVPEPATLSILGLGAVAVLRRRFKKG